MKPSAHKTASQSSLATTDELIVRSLAKLDSLALGIAVGTFCGLVVFFATNFLILKGGEPVGQNLSLLNQYFIGYQVTVAGSIVGLICGFVVGFVLGWLVAFLRNAVIGIYEHLFKLKSNLSAINDLIDHP